MRALVTGGVGFIGFHTVRRWADAGHVVLVLDNFSRSGVEGNAAALGDLANVEILGGDVRERPTVEELFRRHGPVDLVLHLAAQVAVTTSVEAPNFDFETNALGTLNVLEAVRRLCPAAQVLFTSTNKVYGGLAGARIEEDSDRYRLADLPEGISEAQPLDFLSPYGCSKGAADQYVRDYARTFGLATTVLRLSCVYGTHQCGMADQGWVSWFAQALRDERELTIYGDGKQVRDVLWVEDLVDLFDLCVRHRDRVAGEVFNVGGGPTRAVPVLGVLRMLEERLGVTWGERFADWRVGDQRIYVSDARRVGEMLGWGPTVGVEEGIDRLLQGLS